MLLRIMAVIAEAIDEEVGAGQLRTARGGVHAGLRDRPARRGVLINDAVAGMRADVDRLRQVEAALLGVAPPRRRRYLVYVATRNPVVFGAADLAALRAALDAAG
jgi:hypothetical protein